MPERDRQLNIRMMVSELEMLGDLARDLGVSQSDVVRQLIRKAFEGRVKASLRAKPPKREKRLL
jgi:DNA-binding MarR family transcriptional regulator